MDVKREKAGFGDLMSFIAEKKRKEENDWKATIRDRIEDDLNSQVRKAFDNPPLAKRKLQKRRDRDQNRWRNLQIMKLKTLSHGQPPIFARLSDETSSERGFKYIDVNYAEKVAALTRNHRFENFASKSLPGFDFARKNGLFRYGATMPSGEGRQMRGGLDVTLFDTSPSSLNFLTLPKHDNVSGLKPMGGDVGVFTFNGISLPNYGPKRKCFQVYSKDGLSNILNSRNRRNKLNHIGQGNYVDKRGIVLSKHGPFWPPGYGPVCKCPSFIQDCEKREEFGPSTGMTVKVQPADTKWRHTSVHRSEGKSRHQPQSIGEFYSNVESRLPANKQQNRWKGKPVIYDCERSSRVPLPHAIPDGVSESLVFESRFESGNLRQVRRIGEFEYELVLRTDMYTKRHTQWYYFRVQNAQRNQKYKFTIINLLKKDSLYNYGMKPLVYSERLANDEELGWHRRGENIRYMPWSNPTRNGLLSLDLQYHSLEFEISFDWDKVEEDNIYLAHCYPYTYSDLKHHLDSIMAHPDTSRHVKREVLCETTAGNACFLLTITDFPDKEKDKYKDLHLEKKGVVLTARVHPGESQASWMMKGVIDFLTSEDYKARQLRKKFIFKIVPMLNPDGVIVGNYRTSLAARDLNRNYRHPKQSTFPTVWHTKQMIDSFSKDHEISLYCDLHGHSRKPLVFMYGCERKAMFAGKQNSADTRTPRDCARDFIEERLFPWLMQKRSPERFSFHGSKYAIRRCKESTGRVVMFRQFGIANSFTLEASFSGTMRKKLDSGRHFNIEDFLSVGRSLCETILDYQQLSESQAMKARVIMELTRDLAQHVMESKPNMEKVNENPAKISKDERLPEAITQKESSTSVAKPGRGREVVEKERGDAKTRERFPAEENKQQRSDTCWTTPRSRLLETGNNVDLRVETTRETALSIPNEPSSEVEEAKAEDSILDDACFELLEQINYQSISHESDTSSDSDSESEPELPEESPISNRHKKKKKKKKRPGYMKSVSAPSSVGKKLESKDSQKPKAYPGFVNKYTNRSNGGIPIYAQERMQERAARRIAEMKIAEEEKRRRQNEVLLGKLDENGIKDEETKAKYAEVYGIRYQLGPQPNKPPFLLYNPFHDMTPIGTSHERNSSFRVKSEGKVTSDDTSREHSAETESEEKNTKSTVSLQNLSFRYSGELKEGRRHDWTLDNDRIVTSLKEWDWGSAIYERSRTIDLGANFLKKDEKVSKIDIVANFGSKNDKTFKEQNRDLSVSLPPTSGGPKNLQQYEILGRTPNSPNQVHSVKGPAITGESILKPHGASQERSKSADHKKTAEIEFRQFSNANEQSAAASQSRLFNKRDADHNGLIFSVHKVDGRKSNKIKPFSNSPQKGANTIYSRITKPLTAGSSNATDLRFNSAR